MKRVEMIHGLERRRLLGGREVALEGLGRQLQLLGDPGALLLGDGLVLVLQPRLGALGLLGLQRPEGGLRLAGLAALRGRGRLQDPQLLHGQPLGGLGPGLRVLGLRDREPRGGHTLPGARLACGGGGPEGLLPSKTAR